MAQVAGHRRFITLLALLCQAVTVTHVPMPQSATASKMEGASEHCAGHGHSRASADDELATTLASDLLRHLNHAGCCGCGLCQCPWAQAPAMACAVLLPRAARPPRAGLAYRLPDIPQFTSTLFRPPI